MRPRNIAAQRGRHRYSSESFTLEQADERLRDFFRHHGFGHLPHEQRRQLAHFYTLLMTEQEHQNFTRLLNIRDVAIKHFVDCLIVSDLHQLQFPLLDIGTGPGFPGIPLKIKHPNDRIILAEGVQKRVEFLKTVREQLKLKSLDIIGRNIGQDFLYPVNGVITRAVEDVGNTLSNVLNSLSVGGQVFFMKGPNVDPEIKATRERWQQNYELTKDIAYKLPNTPHERRLVIFTKVKMAPQVDLDKILDKDFENDPD
jgi:16S rRNA (guanine527-N7)-methyltransferase